MLSLKQHLSVTEVMSRKSKACLQLACLCKQEMLVFTFAFRQYKTHHQLQAAVCLEMSPPWGCGEVLRWLHPFHGFLFRTLTGDLRVPKISQFVSVSKKCLNLSWILMFAVNCNIYQSSRGSVSVPSCPYPRQAGPSFWDGTSTSEVVWSDMEMKILAKPGEVIGLTLFSLAFDSHF